MVVGKRRLIEAVVAKPSLIDQTGTEDPCPAQPHHLGTGMDEGEPFRLDLARVGDSAVVIAEEIQAVERVLLVDLVIDLAYGVVGRHIVGRPKLMVVGPRALVPLLVGKPLPSQLTGGPSVQPAIFKLGALGVIPIPCSAVMASGRLFAGSPFSDTVAGISKELILVTEYVWRSYPPK